MQRIVMKIFILKFLNVIKSRQRIVMQVSLHAGQVVHTRCSCQVINFLPPSRSRSISIEDTYKACTSDNDLSIRSTKKVGGCSWSTQSNSEWKIFSVFIRETVARNRRLCCLCGIMEFASFLMLSASAPSNSHNSWISHSLYPRNQPITLPTL